MAKQLWNVEVTIETIVLAETEKEARRIAHQNSREIFADYHREDWLAREYKYLPYNWELSSTPYGAEDGQTIGQILDEAKGGAE